MSYHFLMHAQRKENPPCEKTPGRKGFGVPAEMVGHGGTDSLGNLTQVLTQLKSGSDHG